MAQRRSVEIRVGIFVLVCLLIGAGLIVKFGKLEKFSAKTYPIVVIFPNIGGLVRQANVMYAGIPVGKVRDIQLSESGAFKVRVTLSIYENYLIRKDAKFVVNQAGLLGDRYVEVIPQTVTAPALRPGDEVEGMSSVDLTEAIRGVVDVLQQAAGTIARIDTAIKRTDAAIARIDELLLSTQNIQHVSVSLSNIEATTSNAVALSASLRTVADDSRLSLSNTLHHFDTAAETIESAAKRVDSLILTNQDQITTIATNLAASTERLNDLLARLQRGDGTAGKLLTDPTLHNELLKLVENWRRHGILYKEPARRPANPGSISK